MAVLPGDGPDQLVEAMAPLAALAPDRFDHQFAALHAHCGGLAFARADLLRTTFAGRAPFPACTRVLRSNSRRCSKLYTKSGISKSLGDVLS